MGESGVQSNEELDQGVWEDILAEADENGDGEIDFNEFKNMMKKLIAPPAASANNNGALNDQNEQNGQISSMRPPDPKGKQVNPAIQVIGKDQFDNIKSPFRLVRVEGK